MKHSLQFFGLIFRSEEKFEKSVTFRCTILPQLPLMVFDEKDLPKEEQENFLISVHVTIIFCGVHEYVKVVLPVMP